MDFFITGLPRSRTAWLANFFTSGSVFCWHDLLRTKKPCDLDQYESLPGVAHYGDSDSALLLCAEQVQRLHPDAHWVVVHRPAKACEKSFRDYFGKHPYPGVTEENVEFAFRMVTDKLVETVNTLKPANVLHVQFDELNDVRVMRDIWHWCVGDLRFPVERFKLLNQLRVNVMPEKFEIC